jgi:molybdopterin converting factor small subunit
MLKAKFYTQRDDVIAVAILPLYYLFFNYMIFGSVYFKRWEVFGYATLSIVLIWTPIYFLHALPAIYLRKRFPETEQSWVRMSIAIVIHMTMSGLTICGFFYGYQWANFPGFVFNETNLYICLAVTWFINVLLNILHEYIYTFERWKQANTEAKELKIANIQIQLESLKQQVNPHFLFNSLNSLTALINENPQQAETFAEELSTVYRYVLRANEQTLVDLDTELAFIESYYHLLKTRHGNGLEMMVLVDKRLRKYQLPPLTLQLLVENAVKHNVVLPEQPLRIQIQTTEDGHLLVRNNLQRKQTPTFSTGIGLSNILVKYQMLGQVRPVVQESDRDFVVTLPLIPNL